MPSPTSAVVIDPTKHPCKLGPNQTPCNKLEVGQPYDISVHCRLCWLFNHDVQYNLAWGGDGKVASAPNGVIDTRSNTPTVKRELLGDKVKNALTKIGITKDRVEEWIGGPCGCVERQQRLNELHEWAEQVLAEKASNAKGWLMRMIGLGG